MNIKAYMVPENWTRNSANWFYGNDYMVKISKAAAATLCGMYPLPNPGYGTIVAVKQEVWGKLRLEVQNISGTYVLASADTKISEWGSVFGVNVSLRVKTNA